MCSVLPIYVAGKWADREEIGKFIDHLPPQFQATWNWTKTEDNHVDISKMARAASNDIRGVQKAKVLVVMMTDPEYAYRGTWTEIGAALALGKPVICMAPWFDGKVGSSATSNVFFHHPSIVHVKTRDQVLAQLHKHHDLSIQCYFD